MCDIATAAIAAGAALAPAAVTGLGLDGALAVTGLLLIGLTAFTAIAFLTPAISVALINERLDLIMIPKAAHPADIYTIDVLLTQIEAATGRPPDFVDGHHHIQHLPGVREIVVALVRGRYPGRNLYLRSAWDRLYSNLQCGA